MPLTTSAPKPTSSYLWLLLPLLALLALAPLFAHGCSCGHDITFHLQSWLDAASQLRHGTLYPSWATSPAFNAGEPRFIFYPPLSWLLGELLTLALPFSIVPAAYTWLCLSAAGLSMYAVARRIVSPAAALAAAALYLANPYILFTALERTAFAELLAAAWIPWLLLAALRTRPRAFDIAWPLALLWLTNAPAAVMGSYTVAIICIVRLILVFRARHNLWPALCSFLTGAATGLALPAFYLIPAASERRFVQINMALVPGLSVPNNFLFAHTADTFHDFVNHQASHLAIVLLLAAALAIAAAYELSTPAPVRNDPSDPLAAVLAVTSDRSRPVTLLILAIVTGVIAVLLVHPSQPLWLHLPELAFLQFPWRWLMVLAPVAALATALAFTRLRSIPIAIAVAFTAVLALSLPLSHLYMYRCEANESPAAVAQLFHTYHGVTGTDEYTPTDADNDFLRSDDPGYWLSPTPDAFAPNTTPNPNATQPDVDFGTPPPSQTLSAPAPHHLTLNLPQPETLILNLRDYPNWVLTRTGPGARGLQHPAHILRDDGLLAVALPAGPSTIDIRWHTGRDRILGALLSLLALALLFAMRPSHFPRRLNHPPVGLLAFVAGRRNPPTPPLT